MEIQTLYNFIEQKVSLSEHEKELIASKISIVDYKKGEELLKLNQLSNKLYFVLSGIYRVYQLNDGKEITSYFNYKNRNPFVASFVSLLTQKPSKEIIECIEDGQLLSINYSDWLDLYEKSQNINSFGRIMAEYNYILAIERIESLQYHQAKDRYLSFMKLYPNLLNMIPHHYIASYLGITPESLSRVRKEILKN